LKLPPLTFQLNFKQVIVSRHTIQFLCRPSSTHVDEEKQDVLFASQNVTTSTTADPLDLEQDHVSRMSRLFTAITLVIVAQVPIFFVNNLGSVLLLTGGLAGITLCFILPAACQLKLASVNGWCSDHFVPCLSIAIGFVGALAAIISTAVGARHNDVTN
jgi:hypothetical protein